MRNKLQFEFPQLRESAQAPLDLVIPFTTPDLTRSSIRAAEHLAGHVHAEVRLIRIQIVPFPLQLATPPVPVEFLREQVGGLGSGLPLKREIKLAREFESTLLSSLRADSVVFISAKKRPWRTRNERLAASLRRAGYPVILTFEGEDHA